MKRLLSILLVGIFGSFTTFGQGNTCATAYSFGSLPTPVGCGGPSGTGIGTTTSHNGTSVGATAANPYTYIPDCGAGTTDMAAPAIDVWYSFVATGTLLQMDMLSNIPSINIGFYTGTCNNLTAIGCYIDGADGDFTDLVFEPLTPGQTYYIQVSGNDAVTTGNWTITLNNNLDCNDCLRLSSLTATPPPINGTYGPNQTVTFCYTISTYEQVSSNWLHGVQIATTGWASMSPSASDAPGTFSGPAGCDGNGNWMYLAAGDGDIPAGFGPGFYYESDAGCAPCDADDPEDNFGDFNAQNCDLRFCWTLTTPAVCTPGTTFSVVVNTSADGESGSWTSSACTDDPATTFDAIASCCTPPTMTSVAATCGLPNGSATATVTNLASPWDYYWYNSSGTLIATVMDGTNANTLSSLPAGNYSVVVIDNNGCSTGANVTVTSPASPTVTVPSNITVCANGTVATTSFTSNPAGGTFTWTNSNTNIGLPASGSGQITSFTATNSGLTPISGTITVTPTVAGCAGIPSSYTITVTPAPVVTVTASPDALICLGESVPLTGTYTPQPAIIPETFTNATLTTIKNGCGGGCAPGVISVASTGISPATLQAGQLQSVCFTIRHEEFSDLVNLTVTVGGVTYTGGGTAMAPVPAGATYSATLNTFLTSVVNANYGESNGNPVAQTFCLPAAFLTFIEGTGAATNTTWSVGITDNQTGSTNGQFLDLTVIILDYQQYTYSWTPTGTITSGSTSGTTLGGALNVTAQPAASTTYTLNVTDQNGCTGIGTINITVQPLPTASISGTASYCSSLAPTTGVSIPVTLTGTPNWTLTYDTDGNLGTLGDRVTVSGITSSPYVITNALAGTYQLVSVSDQGCAGGTVSGTFTVTVNPNPTASITPDPAVVCAGLNLFMNGGPAGGSSVYTTHSWTGTGAGSLSATNVVNPTFNNLTGGTYALTYTVTDNQGCTGTDNISVLVNSLPTISGTLSACVGGTSALTGSAAPAAVNPWVSSNTSVATISSVGLVTAVSAGSSTITYINSNGCQITAIFTVNALPTITGTPVVCVGSTTALAGSASPAVVNPWVSSNTAVATVNSSGVVSGVSAGSTVITYTNSNGCQITQNVTVNPQPTASIAGGDTYCAGVPISNITVTLTGSPNWTINYTLNGAPMSSNAASFLFSLGNAAGTYTLTSVTDALCSNTATGTQVITINPAPVITLTPDDPNACNDTDGSILVSGSGTGTVSWTGTATGSQSGTTLPFTIPTLGAGSYSVTFLDNATGCTSLATPTSLNNPGAPVLSLIDDVVLCGGSYSLPTISGTPINAPLYYTLPGGPSGGGVVVPVSTSYSAPTNITLYAYDANGACVDEEPFTVIIDPLPTASISGGASYCTGQVASNIEVAVTGEPSWTVNYTYNGTPFSVSGATTPISLGNLPGTYTITGISDGNTCSNTASGSETIIVNPLPTATISGGASYCAGQPVGNIQVALTGTANWTVNYTLNGAPQTLSGIASTTISLGNAPGTYVLTGVSDGNTCSNSATGTQTIIVNPLPTASLTGGNVYCTGATPANIQLTLTGTPIWQVNYTFNGAPQTVSPASSLFSLGNAAGTYVLVDVTDGFCSNVASESQSITLTPLPTASISGGAVYCAGDVVNDVLVNATGTPNWTVDYTLDGVSQTLSGSATNTISLGNAPGVYVLTSITDAACSNSALGSTTIVVNPNPTPSISPDPAEVCAGSDLILNGIPTLGSGVYSSHSWTGTGAGSLNNSAIVSPTFNNLTGGTYDLTYTVTDNFNCIGTDVITVTVNSNPTAMISPDPAEVCAGSDLILNGSPSGGSGVYSSHAWTGSGAGSIVDQTIVGPTFNSFIDGTFDLTYTVTDDNNCVRSDIITVTVNSNPTVLIDPNPAEVCAGADLALNGNPTGGSGVYSAHTWTGTGAGSLNNSSIVNPTFNSMTGGSFDLTYTVTDDNSCTGADVLTVTVYAVPTIDPLGPITACATYALPAITGTNVTSNAAYYDDTQANGGQVITGSVTQSGTYYMYNGANGCSDEESVIITINPLPTVTSVMGGNVYCAGDVVNNIEAMVTGSANWTINYTLDGVAQTASGSTSPITLGNAAGIYIVTNVTDGNCTNTAAGSQTIVVNPIPVAPTAGTDFVYCSSWSLNDMTVNGTGGTYTWYSDNTLTTVLGTGLSLSPIDVNGTSNYYVTETVAGCEGPADMVTITIEDCEIIVPTAITPNGDGVHDDWEIVDLDDVYPDNVVTVYNRWGAKLYESDKGNYASKPWDGKFEGSALPVASYYFVIDFNLPDVEPMKGIVSIVLDK